ncbi:excinuclease ABC subunit UvrC [Alphaproteobacteria bacterium]|nr:excinuclease ABC subunit UvrC [Alphaproteobacteria bacterium]
MVEKEKKSMLSIGQDVIRCFVKTLPQAPGVYRMLGESEDVLYVGKAKSLKKRVVSYVNVGQLSARLQTMVSLTRKMEFIVTQTEAEALLLEANLIKRLKPRYNVLLRDDKSFPYILLTGNHDFPLVKKHRGAKKAKGSYFGPFASAGSVNRTIATLQRVFMLRNCSDNVFANRARPCLQYHIKRCTAPCVGYVDREQYGEQVAQAREFLDGNSAKIQKKFAGEMQKASDAHDYEEAAKFRDRIQALSSIQAKQDINFEGVKNADVMTIVQKDGQACVQVFFFRSGHNFGNHAYFPRHAADESLESILLAVLGQFYQSKIPPQEIVLNVDVAEKDVLERALMEQVKLFGSMHKVKITRPQRGVRRRMLDFAEKNAQAALERHLGQKASQARSLEGVRKLFKLEDVPQRIEVYDNSHISGTNMVGAMIVAGVNGFEKNSYRKFNIKKAGASDDYGMMREVLERRFGRALKDDNYLEDENWPDVVLIDGGLGQYNAVLEVLTELGIAEQVALVAIAKGVDRNAGRETFFTKDSKGFDLKPNDPVLYYLQNLRDEAHRFAIGAHRARRGKETIRSELDQIPGIGPSRKKTLLHHFGSAKAVAEAPVSDLMRVKGISKDVAQKIYDFFHEK